MKEIRISDQAYDWLTARGRGQADVPVVLDRVISLVKRFEADQEKYRRWVDASRGRRKVEMEELKGKGGSNDTGNLGSEAERR